MSQQSRMNLNGSFLSFPALPLTVYFLLLYEFPSLRIPTVSKGKTVFQIHHERSYIDINIFFFKVNQMHSVWTRVLKPNILDT